MIIGCTFHTHSMSQAIEAVQQPAKPAEKLATTDDNHRENNTQSTSNSSNLDSLGQGNLL